MEKVLLSHMQEGKTYTVPLLVSDISERVASNKKPFVVFSLSDGDSTVSANMFSSTLLENARYNKRVCEVSLQVSIYNGSLSYTVKKIGEMEEGTYNLGDFIIKAPIDCGRMYAKIIEVLGECETNLKQVGINLFEANKEKILYWSAAKSFHHDYYGGFLYHTYRMLSHASWVCKIYTGLNKDLLLIGTALHDIGKLVELDTDAMGIASYSIDGNLFGHLLIGIEMITEEVLKNKDAYKEEEVRLLKHMIASHHGGLDMGSIREPSTMEAIALHFIDVMDARMETCDATYKGMEKGEITDRKILGLNAYLYKPNM